MSYDETRLQFVTDVQLPDELYSDMVMCWIASKHVRQVRTKPRLSSSGTSLASSARVFFRTKPALAMVI